MNAVKNEIEKLKMIKSCACDDAFSEKTLESLHDAIEYEKLHSHESPFAAVGHHIIEFDMLDVFWSGEIARCYLDAGFSHANLIDAGFMRIPRRDGAK